MKGYFIGVVVGATCMAGGMLMARGNQPPCLDMMVVSQLVDGCMGGDREACALMDRTVPSSCLMERAVEAHEAGQLRFDGPRPEDITL